MPTLPLLYVPRPPEWIGWMPIPEMMNANALYFPSTLQTVPPFVVPRPAEQQPWQMPPDWQTANTLILLKIGGNPFHKLWRWDYEPDKFWLGTPQAAAALNELDFKPTSPTKQWRWDNVPATEWTGTPQEAYTLRILNHSPTSPAKFWHWEPDPPPSWAPIPEMMDADALYIPAGNPFHKLWLWDHVPEPPWQMTPEWMNSASMQMLDYQPTARFYSPWRYDYVPPPDWQMPNEWMNATNLQVLYNKAATHFWRWDYQVPPDWQMALDFINAPISFISTFTGVVQSPVYALKGDQDIKPWQWEPPYNINIDAPSANPFHQLWRWDFAPEQPWQMPVFWQDSAIIGILDFKPTSPAKLWHWEPDPPAPWSPIPEMMDADALYFPTAEPFNKLWRWDHVPVPDWQMPSQWMSAATLEQLDYKTTSKTKLWRWDHVPEPPWNMPVFWQNSAVINQLDYKTTAKTKQWHYDWDSDVRVWQAQPVASNIETFPALAPFQTLVVPRLAELQSWQWSPLLNPQLFMPPPPFSKLWRYDTDSDVRLWLGQPVSSQSAYLQTLFQLYGISPVWVPDFVQPYDWLGTPLAPSTIQQLEYAPTSPTKLWRWDHVPTTEWLGTPLIAYALQQLDHVPTSPTKFWRWDYVSPPDWLGTPLVAAATQQLEFRPTSPPKLWTWNFVPQPDWLGTPQTAVAAQLLAFMPTSPPKLWRWDQVPPPDWLGTPQAAAILQQLEYAPTSPTKQWRYDYDNDVRLWLGQPTATNINTFPLLAPFSRLWRYDLITDTYWLGTPQAAAVLQQLEYVPFSRLWRYDLNTDTALWLGTPLAIPQLNLPPLSPFYRLWRFNTVPQPDWPGLPLIAYTLQLLNYPTTSPTKQWRWNYVPQPDWLGTPLAAYTLQDLSHIPTSRPKLWRWDYVPPPDWIGTPLSAYSLEDLGRRPTSPAKFWRWDQVPQPDWIGTPIVSYTLQQLSHAPTSQTKFWRWDWDSDARIWLARPVATNIEFIPKPTKPKPGTGQNPLWMGAYGYDPPSPWIWTPPYSSLRLPPPAPPIPPTPVPRRTAYKNLFPPTLNYTVANPNMLLRTPSLTSSLVKVYIGEPATVYLGIFDIAPVEYAVTASSVQLQFIRPDGTFYYVVGSPYTYISQVYGQPFITYTSAVGEFNQVGWWTAVFSIGNAVSQQFAFYIHAPGQ